MNNKVYEVKYDCKMDLTKSEAVIYLEKFGADFGRYRAVEGAFEKKLVLGINNHNRNCSKGYMVSLQKDEKHISVVLLNCTNREALNNALADLAISIQNK